MSKELLQAIEENREQDVIKLLKEGADPYYHDDEEFTSTILKAVENGNAAIFKLIFDSIIDSGKNISESDIESIKNIIKNEVTDEKQAAYDNISNILYEYDESHPITVEQQYKKHIEEKQLHNERKKQEAIQKDIPVDRTGIKKAKDALLREGRFAAGNPLSSSVSQEPKFFVEKQKKGVHWSDGEQITEIRESFKDEKKPIIAQKPSKQVITEFEKEKLIRDQSRKERLQEIQDLPEIVELQRGMRNAKQFEDHVHTYTSKKPELNDIEEEPIETSVAQQARNIIPASLIQKPEGEEKLKSPLTHLYGDIVRELNRLRDDPEIQSQLKQSRLHKGTVAR